MNQGKLEVVKKEMPRVNVDMLVISEWKWMWTGKFKADEHYIKYCEQESLRKIGEDLIVSKRAWNAELGCNLKKWQNDLDLFQRQTFSITVIQVYAPTTIAKEYEVE